MSLDVAKLEKVRELDGGIVQARCPACAEGGNDRTGEHLRIYPDGRFGCCVHPKDRDHRKKIWAVAGVRKAGTFTLRLTAPSAAPTALSVKAVLTFGTLGTGKTNSGTDCQTIQQPLVNDFGTLGTPNSNSRAYTRELDIRNIYIPEQLKELEPPVPNVPPSGGRPSLVAGERLPFLTAGGDLSIPFDSPERYHWWRGGQSVETTLAEVRAALASQKG